MIFDIDDSVDIFEPEYEGNRTLPEAERIRIHVGPLSYVADSRAQRKAVAIVRSQATQGDAEDIAFVEAYQSECFAERIKKIENINVRNKQGEVRPLTDPRELFMASLPLSRITQEITQEVRRRETVDKKKLVSDLPSGSTVLQEVAEAKPPHGQKVIKSLSVKAKVL